LLQSGVNEGVITKDHPRNTEINIDAGIPMYYKDVPAPHRNEGQVCAFRLVNETGSSLQREPTFMDSPSVPAVLALLLCDQVITDAQTHKKSLIGVFQNVNSFSFPAPLKVALYAKLADAEGNYDLKVRVVRLKDDSLLYNFEIKGARVVTQLQPSIW